MREDWLKLPMKYFTEFGLTPTEAAILAFLVDRGKANDGIAHYKQKHIAKQLNISLRTVISAIHRLESIGLIEQVRTGRASAYYIEVDAQIKRKWEDPLTTKKSKKEIEELIDIIEKNVNKV